MNDGLFYFLNEAFFSLVRDGPNNMNWLEMVVNKTG